MAAEQRVPIHGPTELTSPLTGSRFLVAGHATTAVFRAGELMLLDRQGCLMVRIPDPADQGGSGFFRNPALEAQLASEIAILEAERRSWVL